MRHTLLLACLALVFPLRLPAQELQPRTLVNLPVRLNIVTAAAGYARGNLLLEPTLPIEDGKAELFTVIPGFFRTFGLLGMSAQAGVLVPWVTGTWRGRLAGADTSTDRTGIGDVQLRMSFNFAGAPAVTRSEFAGYRQRTVAGVTMAVGMPVGQYYPERLINLGTNRWAFSARAGASHLAGRFLLEATGSATVYTTNHDFYGGRTLEQHPFYDAQAHLAYGIRGAQLWAAGSIGYGWGGRTVVDGNPGQPLENVRASATLRLPLAPGHALKLVFIHGLHTRLGTDFDTFQGVYQYVWGGS